MAERHVRENEARIARQEEVLAELERDDHAALAEEAQKLLATFQALQKLAREHLERERAERGL